MREAFGGTFTIQLQGELFLVLNSEGTAELAGKKLYYNPQFGLAEKEE